MAVEKLARKISRLVATVGQIQAEPGASNVIPGEVTLTLDVRHHHDSVRRKACLALQKHARLIARTRKGKVQWMPVQQFSSIPCFPQISKLLVEAAGKHQRKVISLASGAGHDAVVMGKITPAAMLFIRCKGGTSHHPDESASLADVAVALKVMNTFIQSLAAKS